jgi:hypothetical protein
VIVRVIKSMVGLFLVLAIQLFQVQPALASIVSTSCATEAEASCCCSGEDHCPCAKSAPDKETKAPLGPVSSETKAPEFVDPSSGIPTENFGIQFSPDVRASLACGHFPIGYLGVSLSVAFCRFVI